ncbi:hypothetical protein D3C75_1097650 [compost metagenome]
MIFWRDPLVLFQKRDRTFDIVDGVRQGNQVVIEEAPSHHQQIIFLLHLLYQFLDLVVLISPHDEGIGNKERSTTMNGRREVLHYGLFILSQQDVQPQIFLMQISQQRCPIKTE